MPMMAFMAGGRLTYALPTLAIPPYGLQEDTVDLRSRPNRCTFPRRMRQPKCRLLYVSGGFSQVPELGLRCFRVGQGRVSGQENARGMGYRNIPAVSQTNCADPLQLLVVFAALTL